jgi:hypothetical protein
MVLDYHNIKTSPQSRCQNVTLQYSKIKSNIWLKISDITPFNVTYTPLHDNILTLSEFLEINPGYNKTLPDNLLHLSFKSFHFHNNQKYDGVYRDVTLEPSYFLLYPGQAYFVTLYPIVVIECSSCLSRLELNPQLKQLPVKLQPNEINFGIRPHSYFFKSEENKPGYNCNYLQIMFNTFIILI